MLDLSYTPEVANLIFNSLYQQSRIIEEINSIYLFLQKEIDGWSLLMLALRYSPKAADMLLDFLGQYSNKFDSKTMTKILLEKNANGWNALALAKSYCPATTVKTIYTLLSRHKRHQLFNKLVAFNPKQAKDIHSMGAIIDNNSRYLLKYFF